LPIEIYDLPTGARYIRIPHHADPEKDEKWLAAVEKEMLDTPHLFRQQILMEDTISEGLIFPHFQAAMTKRFTIPPTWTRYSGHDFGPIHTAACFAAQDPKSGIVYIYGTYQPNKARTTEEHAQAWLSMQGLKHAPRAWGGAPSEDNWRSDFADVGYRIERPPIADLFEGIYRLDSLFKRGLVKVFDDLTNLCEEFFAYSYELNEEGVPIDRKIANKAVFHRIDCCRYLATALYEGLAGVAPEPESRFEKEEEFKRKPNHAERLAAGFRA
jgi:hypothetical protein